MANMASGDLSLISTSSQEEESSEYVGYDRTLRPSSNSSGSTSAANMANNNNNNNGGNGGGGVVNVGLTSGSGGIPTAGGGGPGVGGGGVNSGGAGTPGSGKKYDTIKTKYDSALLELSALRRQHSDTVQRCDDLSSDLAFYQEQYMAAMNQLKSSDRNKFTDIAAENARLKQQNNMLERKLLRLEQENGNVAAMQQQQSFYADYAAVQAARGKCDGSCSSTTEKLLEQVQVLKDRHGELLKERNALTAEKEKYKKNFSSAIAELENVKKERNFYHEAGDQFNAQRELMKKENLKLKALLDTESNKVMLITVQRNRIEEELNQLLSEKDNVLQEHQKMSDDLASANKELEQMKKDEALCRNEMKALVQANAELKKRDLLKSRESSWSKEDGKDDQLEKLRKSLEKAQLEVQRAQQDTEEAKRVRDWAISQREKIVQERDSVKTLCDNLRKERDKAISDLLSAIRDSEKIKKQKDEAQKKIDLLREQLETQNLDTASRRSFRMSSYEAEDLLAVELGPYHSDSDLGIILDDSHNKQLVCGVTNASPAFGKLKINDVIRKVNQLECQTLTKRMVLDEIRASAPRCNLMVSRTRHSKRHFYTVHLNLQDNPNHGLGLDTGVFISKIEPNSLAAYEPELDVGDRVLSINNKSMEGVSSVDDIMALLNDERNESITIFALKNVQDAAAAAAGGYGELGGVPRRMTTSSAQTDSIDSVHRATNSGKQSKLTEILSKFREKIHISKPGSDTDHFAQENDALAALDSVLSENSSEKSKENLFKRSKRGKKEKEAAAKITGTWPRTNILNASHDNPTATIVHRGEKKRAPLSLFTAAPINVDKDDERDPMDDVPPPLPPQAKPQLALRNINGSVIKTNPNRNSNPIPSAALFVYRQPGGGGGGGGVSGTGSDQGGPAYHMRHSVYGGLPSSSPMEHEPMLLEHTKPLQRPAPIMGANMRVKMPPREGSQYGQSSSSGGGMRQHQHNQNRYSLNITPTAFYKTSGQQAQQQVINNGNGGGGGGGGGAEMLSRKQHLFEMPTSGGSSSKSSPHPALFLPVIPHNAFPRNHQQLQQHQQQQQQQQQQNSLDMISIKSQNSIDSILSTKSPPISEYAVTNYPKRGVPMPQSAPGGGGVKNVAKYPSDSESIASGIVGGGGAGGHNGGGGLFYGGSNGPASSNRHTQLFPTFMPGNQPYSHQLRQIRHSSPLTLPSPPPLHPHSHPHNSQVGENAGNGGAGGAGGGGSGIGIPSSSVDKFDVDYVTPPHNHHPHAAYMQEQNYMYHHGQGSGQQSGPPSTGVIYEGGTFPRKKERFRIPSNPSVASKNSSGVKNSSGSIDHHYGTSGGGGGSGGASVSSPLMQSSGGTASMLMHHPQHHAAMVNANLVGLATNGVGGGGGGGGGSGRGSPMPQVHVEVLSHGGSKRNSNVPADFLFPGDLRRVTIEKSDKSLGITIQCNNNGGGIFVSTVADKSIATRAGLQVGDQLLEVCGLNMRSATNDIAANVLRQCGNSITMLVQYNPEKFHSAEYDGTNNLEPESPVNHSGSPTPRNSPRPPARSMMASSLPPLPMPLPAGLQMQGVPNSIQLPPSSNSMLSAQSSSIKDHSFADSLENQSDISSSQDLPSSSAATTTTTASNASTVYEEEARYLTLHMDKSKNLGIKLFGGNKVGIFVHDVHPGSPSDHAGIRKGDQILEYNGVDLRCVTAEQAANEISKLTDTVTMLVQNKLKKLKQIKDKSGDSFYIRVGFDRTGGDLNEGDLRFVKDEVLYVDNTVFNGTFGLWRAWKLDAKGHRKECGIIPSQMKVEEEMRSGEVVDCDGGTARRGSTSARRSFFRRKKHQRSSSRDSTEIASFSNTQLSFFPDSGILNDDGGILSYQRVERLDSPVRRPVLIIGPLSECVMERLTMDFSNLFKLCEVTAMDCSQDAMEEGLQENIFVDYRRRGNKFECTTVESINNSCKNDRRHCILDISISAVERLQRLQIYPIVLLLRFKSAKQIREIRDIGTDKITAKAAKEMYERALKLEADYKQYISAVIPGVSIKHMCTQIKDSVDKEQDKLLWVPVVNG